MIQEIIKLDILVRQMIVEAAKYYKVREGSISGCCRGCNKTIKGFVWKFKTENI